MKDKTEQTEQPINNNQITNKSENTIHFVVKKSRMIKEQTWQAWIGIEYGMDFPASQETESIEKIFERSEEMMEKAVELEKESRDFDDL